MEEHILEMENIEKYNKYQKKPHFHAPLAMKNDYLSPDQCLDWEEIDQAYHRARDHEKDMIEDGKNQN